MVLLYSSILFYLFILLDYSLLFRSKKFLGSRCFITICELWRHMFHGLPAEWRVDEEFCKYALTTDFCDSLFSIKF